MFKNLSNKRLFATSFALVMPFSLFSDASSQNAELASIQAQIDACTTTTIRGTEGAKLASATPNIKGHRVFIQTDVILFQLFEDLSVYASNLSRPIVTAPNNGNSAVSPGERKEFQTHFDWAWGFKTALGYYAPHDDWQTAFSFTYLQTQTRSSVSASDPYYINPSLYLSEFGVNQVFPTSPTVISTQPSYYINGHENWKVSFYNLDWTLGKDFFVSKYVSFLTNIGVKTAWFYQDHNLDYTTNNNLISGFKFDDNYTGVGPKADVTAKLYLSKHFTIVGKVDAALLYATNDLSYNIQTFSTTATSSANYVYATDHQKQRHISPFLGFDLGLGYDSNFFKDRFNFALQLSYGQQYYNKASRQVYTNSPTANDISFQTVDLSLVFSF